MAKAKAGKLNALLESAIAEELKLVREKHTEDVWEGEGEEKKAVAKKGDYKHSTTERMKVIDRALKLETIKLKADDPDFGSEFDK